MTDEKKKKGVSRREFIAGTVGGVVVGAVVGAAAGSFGFPKTVTQTETQTATVTTASVTTAQPWLPTKWDQTADVVVVGYGGSGAITAISAYDAGAKVLILEKTPSYASMGVSNPPISGGGGNTSMLAGGSNNVTDPVAAANYLYQVDWGNTPMPVLQALCQQEMDTTAWFDKMGVKYSTPAVGASEFPSLGGANCFNTFMLTGGGFAYFQALDAQVQKRGIPILFNTPATSLIQNGNTKEIIGVVASSGGSTINVKANKAVALTTGSFEYNETLKADNLRCYPLHASGWQFNTGDAVTMASKVGAAMWHMGICSLNLAAWFPDYPIGFGGSSPSGGYIYVDVHGNRWGNETALGFGPNSHTWNFWLELSDFDFSIPGYTRIPTFVIFDSVGMKAGPISSGKSATSQLPNQLDPRPVWSSDNSVELGKGWIQQGADIPSLAAAMSAKTYVGLPTGSSNTGPAAKINVKIDPAVLTATINNWNAMVAAGKGDTSFGRAASSMKPISTPPYYSMPLWPGGPSLYGGPVRNEKMQICDASNNKIPRLYGAGESGNVTGGLLDVVTNTAQMVACGRIAGANAAAETPWS